MQRMKGLLTAAFVLMASSLFGQGIRFETQVLSSGGFPNPTVRVCTEPASGTPCTPLASVFSDSGLSNPLPNPFTGDASGNIYFYANPSSKYHLQISGNGINTYDIPDVTLPGGSGGGGSGGTFIQINGAAVPAPSANFNNSAPVPPANALNLAFQKDASGIITNISANVPYAGGTQLGVLQLAGDLGGTPTSPQVISTHFPSGLPVSQGGTGATDAITAFNNLAPATGAGGLIVGSGTNTYGNLPVGTSGTCLVSSGTSVVWQACPGGGGGGLADPGGNGIIKRTSLNVTAPAAAADVAALFSGCSGSQYLGADGACHSPSGGLADPGTNGPIKRTALNVTAAAGSADIVGLFASCSGTQYLGADGACHTPGGALVLRTNGTLNSSQSLLNIAAGIGMTVTESSGTVTLNASGGGSGIVPNPAGAQAIVQPIVSNVTSNFSANNFNQIRYFTPSYNWTATPGTPSSIVVGSNTVILSTCPSGMNLSNLNTQVQGLPSFFISLPDHGTPEFVLVTGGTCIPGMTNGTVTFTAVNTHSAGYSIGSASSGFQEAVNDSCYFAPHGFATPITKGGELILPAQTSITVNAPIYFGCNAWTIDMTGATVKCNVTNSACLFVGSPSNSLYSVDITVINPQLLPAVTGGTGPGIEVNAQKTRIMNYTPHYNYGNSTATFGTLLQVDDDQAFLLDGMDTGDVDQVSGAGLVCNATQCGAAIQTGSGFAVGWLKHLNFTLQCHANGINWLSGNSLHVTDSVIQGQAQYGIRVLSTFNTTPNSFSNVYYEVGSCTNPNGIGIAGLIARSGDVELTPLGPGGPSGAYPQYSCTTSGSSRLTYYLIPKNGARAMTPIPIGFSLTDGTGSCTVKWPKAGTTTTTYDLLSEPGNLSGASAPFGTGNFARQTGLVSSSVCAGSGDQAVCSVTDSTSASPTSYTVASRQFAPTLPFWPGPIVLTNQVDDSSSIASLITDTIQASGVISSGGENFNNITASACLTQANSFFPTSVPFVCNNSDPLFSGVAAQLRYIGTTGGLKGGINVGIQNGNTTASGQSTDILTLLDMCPQCTTAKLGFRPANTDSLSINDIAFGIDATSGPGNGVASGYVRAGTSWSQYIGTAPTGASPTNWLSRLTSSLMEYKVAAQFDLGVTSKASIGVSTGSGIAGEVDFVQGTLPAVTANAVGIVAPTSVPSAYQITVPGSLPASTGVLLSNSTGVTTWTDPNSLVPSYNHTGSLLTGVHIVQDSGTMTGGTLAVTLTSSAVFTSSSSYVCSANDVTAANPVQITYASGSSVSFIGTSGDVVRYQCRGN